MVSSNATPIDGKLPGDWSLTENQRVLSIYKKLAGSRDAALVPAIIQAVDRSEYAVAIDITVEYESVTVGDLCRKILEKWYDPIGDLYKAREVNGKTRAGLSYFSVKTKDELGQWWKENSNKADSDIEEFICKIRISEEESFGYKSDKDKEYYQNLMKLRCGVKYGDRNRE
jgi:hypothetical protein